MPKKRKISQNILIKTRNDTLLRWSFLVDKIIMQYQKRGDLPAYIENDIYLDIQQHLKNQLLNGIILLNTVQEKVLYQRLDAYLKKYIEKENNEITKIHRFAQDNGYKRNIYKKDNKKIEHTELLEKIYQKAASLNLKEEMIFLKSFFKEGNSRIAFTKSITAKKVKVALELLAQMVISEKKIDITFP